jgi:hypothetical protein
MKFAKRWISFKHILDDLLAFPDEIPDKVWILTN